MSSILNTDLKALSQEKKQLSSLFFKHEHLEATVQHGKYFNGGPGLVQLLPFNDRKQITLNFVKN